MVDIAVQKEQKAELHSKLWEMANNLRGNMEAYEFKNYILGLIFYRYLSERTENYMNELLKDDDISYAEAWEDEDGSLACNLGVWSLLSSNVRHNRSVVLEWAVDI